MGGRTDLRPYKAKPQEGFAKEGCNKNPDGRLPCWINGVSLPTDAVDSMKSSFDSIGTDRL